MSKQDTHFFNVFSMIIGLLVAIAIALFALARIVASQTQDKQVVEDASYVKNVEQRVEPFAQEAVAGQDNAALAIKPDYILIQFGHNDGGVNLPGVPPVPDQGLLPGATPPAPPPGATPRPPSGRGSLPGIGAETLDVENPRTHDHETVHTFGWYMRKYIADTRAKGATPILCSLVPRKLWLDGHIIRNTSTYRGWTQQVTAAEHVPFVDLNEIIARRYDALGQPAVEPLFGDPHTHTTLAGAQLNAECVVAGLRALPHDPLAPYLSPKGRAIKPYTP